MYGHFDNIEIKGISTVVPSIVEDNTIYAPVMGERRNKKQIKLTGVYKRHISASNQTSGDLCYGATKYLMDNLKWNLNEVKVMIFITQGPSFRLPSTAFLLHKRLGLPKDCLVYDINLGCSSFNVGIQTICALMQSCSLGEKGLLLVGETASKVKSPHKSYNDDEIAHDMLFGAEGSCIALEKVEHNDVYFMNMSDGEGYQAIMGRFGESTKMDGGAVFTFAINEVSATVNDFIDRVGIDKDDSFFVFHQAQKLILDNLIDSCKIPPENELRSLEEYGNTSGGSVPLSLCANLDRIKNEKKDSYLLCGFGVGLSWGCIYTKIKADCILPIIEYDEFFERRKISRLMVGKKIAVVGADNDLGEWVSKYLYDSCGDMVLIGSHEEILKSECSRLEEHSEYYVNGNIDWDRDRFDGIVFLSDYDEETVLSVCKNVVSRCEDSEVLEAQKTRIVILKDIEEVSEQTGIYELMKKVDNYSDKILINTIIYDDSQMRIEQIHDFGQAWVENYINEGCPDEMVKASYIAINVTHLLSDSSKFTNGSVIRIS